MKENHNKPKLNSLLALVVSPKSLSSSIRAGRLNEEVSMVMKVLLKYCGNIDKGENPNRSLSPTQYVKVNNLEEASKVCIDYICQYDLGGGNWIGGKVTENSKVIANISYNGRIWR